MTEISTAFPRDTETQSVNDPEAGTRPPLPLEQIRRTHKRSFLLISAITLLPLLAAAVLTYAAYSFATSISAHTSANDIVDQVIASAALCKRDELGGGQIFGMVAGVLILLAFVCASLWMFSCAVDGVGRMGRSGQ